MAASGTTKKSGESNDSGGTAKKSSARKSTKKTSTSKSSGSSSSGSSSRSNSSGSRGSAPKAAAPRRTGAREIAAKAASELLELTGKQAEGVTGLERDDDGWTVQVEVVEVRRIPDTTDVLALYEVRTDDRGELESYRRVRRYARGVPGDD